MSPQPSVSGALAVGIIFAMVVAMLVCLSLLLTIDRPESVQPTPIEET